MATKKVLVTRPVHQSENLCHLIEQQGWQAIRFPVIEIQARELALQDECRIQQLEQYQYVFFVSANAVNFALPLFNGKIQCLKTLVSVAVGKATYTALVKHGIERVLLPAQGFNSEEILAMPELQVLTGQSCLIIRGDGGRELLANTLRERGARVDYLEVYKRVIPDYDAVLATDLINKSLTAIVIYSGDALRNLVKMLAAEEEKLLNIPLVVISERVQTLAKNIGFKKIIIADQASDTAMINALLNGEECG